MARAAVAAGADGLIVEVHADPPHAMSDGAQSLFPEQFGELMSQIGPIARAIGRDVFPRLPEPAGAR
jgi:3-deoxy-7-phosphoheptulonate synthase